MHTLAEAAALLGLSPSTLRNQVHNGRLRGRLIGKTWIISSREIARYREESLGRPGRRARGRGRSSMTAADTSVGAGTS